MSDKPHIELTDDAIELVAEKVVKSLSSADLDEMVARGSESGPVEPNEAGVYDIEYPTPAEESFQRYHTLGMSMATFGRHDNLFLKPPADPEELYKVYSRSAYLPAIIDAYAANVYRTGYRLEPTIPLNRPEGRQEVRSILMWEKAQAQVSDGEDPLDMSVDVSDEEVDQAIAKYVQRAELERRFIEQFTQRFSGTLTWCSLWEYTGKDRGITGNAYWEVMRSKQKPRQPARINWLPSITMRVIPPKEQDYVVVNTRAPKGLLEWNDEVKQHIRFPKYVQIGKGPTESVLAYFKCYGDPRVMSRKTGQCYKDLTSLFVAEARDKYNQFYARTDARLPVDERKAEAANTMNRTGQFSALQATEVLHIKEHHGINDLYGWPAWDGATPSVIGTRELDEENLKIIKDEAVPQMMLLIGGGFVGKKSYEKILHSIQARRSGKKGITIIEANSVKRSFNGPQQVPTIEAIKMKDAQHSDGYGLKYDARAEEKILSVRRMPRSQLGKELGSNRAATLMADRFTQNQVYEPEREAAINETMNSKILPDLGIRCWQYKAKAVQPIDPELRTNIIGTLTERGVLTIEEARRLAGPIFNETLTLLDQIWAQLPPRVLTVLLQTKNRELGYALLNNDPEAIKRLVVAAESAILEDGENRNTPEELPLDGDSNSEE